MTIANIRSGIATNLRTISGLRVFEEIPDQVSPPSAVVSLNNIEYHQAFSGGLNIFRFTVRVIVGGQPSVKLNAPRSYAEPTGASSVKSAIESNRTLSGACQDLIVESMPNIGSITVNENDYLAGEFYRHLLRIRRINWQSM
jgi:hypothetical protein